MVDVYSNLIAALSNWQTTDAKIRERNRQVVKGIAEELREKSTGPEQTLDAAFCYYISGYYVHAQALSNINNLVDANKVQKWIFWFMAKRFTDLKAEALDVVTEVGSQDASIRDEIDARNLDRFAVVNRIVVVKIAESFLDIISFIETGENNKYYCAIDTLSKCQKLLFKAREWKIWWWIESLKMISQEFIENSLWHALQPMRGNPTSSDIVHKYISANYKELNIVEFWRTQIECLPKINDPERCSFCITVPTSAGKTKSAELAILRFVLDYENEPNAKCVYIAPLRALCEEVEQTLAKVFRQDGKSKVSKFYGGHEIDIFDEHLWSQTRILVVTPEKLDGMLRQYPELKDQIKLVIADEGHLIGDKDRLTYRFLLERLIYLFRKKNATESRKPRIILMSGVLPNVEGFADLISGSGENVVDIRWRPTDEPRFLKWTWNGQEWEGQEFHEKTQKWESSTPPIPEKLSNCNSQDKFADQVVKTAVSRSRSATVMIFSANRESIEKSEFVTLLTCVARHSPYGTVETTNPAFKVKYPDEALLLESSIAVHHRIVPSEIRREVETRLRKNKIRLLFASPTLVQGVNFPFDVVLIYNLYHYKNRRQLISNSMFWNIVGRVGRPISQIKNRSDLKAPEVVFVVDQSDRQSNKASYDLVRNRGRYWVESPFLDFLKEVKQKAQSLKIPYLISELAEKPKLKDVIGESASNKWSRNEKMTLEQCLIDLDKHLISIMNENDIDTISESTQQVVQELVNLFVKASVIREEEIDFIGEVVLARLKFIIKHIPITQRRQEYLLGLPYEDCEAIKKNVEDLLVWYRGCIGLFSNNRQSGIDNLIRLMSFVTTLSICRKRGKRPAQKSKQPFLMEIDDNSVLEQKRVFTDWLNGVESDDSLFTYGDSKKYRELERNLPWGISAIVRYLNDVVKEKSETVLQDLTYLTSFVKYGASSKIACHLIRYNIPRKVAIAIADLYRDKLLRMGSDEMEFSFSNDSLEAIKSLQSLTDEQIEKLEIDQPTKEIIQRICEQHRTSGNEQIEPEVPPSEMEFI